MVRVNGREIDAAGLSIAALLEREHFEPAKVAVELGEEIVPKAQYAQTVLKDGDAVEVVSFVGGG